MQFSSRPVFKSLIQPIILRRWWGLFLTLLRSRYIPIAALSLQYHKGLVGSVQVHEADIALGRSTLYTTSEWHRKAHSSVSELLISDYISGNLEPLRFKFANDKVLIPI